MDFKTTQIEEILNQYLLEETGYAKTVIEAMNYSFQSGGKRLRPLLMQETYQLFGGKGKIIEPFMAAIEMIHTYSLIHDDLPAMDNDEYRRGRKTTHVVYGEAMAILAGDALLNRAFEVAMSAFPLEIDLEDSMISREQMQGIGRAIAVLGKKAGIQGMIGGQTADIEAEGKQALDTETILYIHEHKTAALIQAAMMVGAILAGASESELEVIEKCGYAIGVAFQIQDDILDIIGDSEQLGKAIGSDEKNQKQTYVTLHGLEASKERVELLSSTAIAYLERIGGENDYLIELVRFLVNRQK